MSRKNTATAIEEFDGNRDTFWTFWNRFTVRLYQEGLNYTVMDEIRTSVVGTQPVYPHPVVTDPSHPDYDPQAATDYEEQREIYRATLRAYQMAMVQYQKDCSKTLGILLNMLQRDLSTEIQGKIESGQAGNNNEDILAFSINYVKNKYGPIDEIDVARIEKEIRDLNDSHGVKPMHRTFQRLQDELSRIKVKDLNGEIELDNAGNPRTHEYTENLKRGFYLERLGRNGNPYWGNLKHKYSTNPNLPYIELLNEIENMLKNSEEWDFIGPLKASTPTTSRAQPAQTTHQYGGTKQCKNCGKFNHWTWECLHNACFRCRKSFPSAEVRKQHDLNAHPDDRKKRAADTTTSSPQQNKRPNTTTSKPTSSSGSNAQQTQTKPMTDKKYGKGGKGKKTQPKKPSSSVSFADTSMDQSETNDEEDA